jgi:hypothetical protein
VADDGDTIEWGGRPGDPPDRPGPLNRLTARVPDDSGAPKPRLRVNYVALGLAVVGFLAALAGQYLPWVHIDLNGLGVPNQSTPAVYDFALGAVNTWQNMAYGLTLVFGLTGLCALLVAGPAIRLLLAATTVGLLLGQVTLLVGMSRSIHEGAGLGTATALTALPDEAMTVGPGYTVAVVATALLLAAALLAARGPRPYRQRADEPVQPDEEPIDLVVAPLPPHDDHA